MKIIFFFSSRRRHTRYWRDWSSDVCSSDLCDPVLSRLRVAKAGKATTRTFGGLPQVESKITLTNLRPGVRTVAIVVNGKAVRTLVLRPGQVRRLDVARFMRPGSNNTVRFTIRGPPGGAVGIMIADI